MRRHATRAEYRAAEAQAIILAVIRFYCDSKRKANIVPARATWRELKFSFPRWAAESAQHITEKELRDQLKWAVKCGDVKEYDSICYKTYEVVPGKADERYMITTI